MNGATSVLKVIKIEVADPPEVSMHDSAFVRHSIPQTFPAKKPTRFTVTWRNTGTIPWSEAENVHLGTQNPHDNTNFGTNRWSILDGVVVQPGQEYTFEFDAVVAAPGVYNFQTKMVDDAPPNWDWIGQPGPSVAVTVTQEEIEEPFVGTINVVFQRGDFSAPAGTVVTNIKTELLNAAGAVVQTHASLAGNAAGDSFTNVPTGNGYKIKISTLNQLGVVLGTPVLTNAVNIVDTPAPVTVQIVLGGVAS
jgi:hypothetical protein